MKAEDLHKVLSKRDPPLYRYGQLKIMGACYRFDVVVDSTPKSRDEFVLVEEIVIPSDPNTKPFVYCRNTHEILRENAEKKVKRWKRENLDVYELDPEPPTAEDVLFYKEIGGGLE